MSDEIPLNPSEPQTPEDYPEGSPVRENGYTSYLPDEDYVQQRIEQIKARCAAQECTPQSMAHAIDCPTKNQGL